MISLTTSTPPPRDKGLLSNSISRNRAPTTGCKTAPLPFPPLIDTDSTASISNFWGSTNTSLTDPTTMGSTLAPDPVALLVVIVIAGGFKTS